MVCTTQTPQCYHACRSSGFESVKRSAFCGIALGNHHNADTLAPLKAELLSCPPEALFSGQASPLLTPSPGGQLFPFGKQFASQKEEPRLSSSLADLERF